ncbi:MAG TPA: TIGR00730 family Rossman fold protein [Ktedonobacterales bacterium]|nr:TIGR00730 family Rossman fold protein [Ktedonobacterales bacterium]
MARDELGLGAHPHAGGRIAVCAGSHMGRLPAYRAAAQDMGHLLAAEGLELLFGGTRDGLMQVVADAVKAGGGKVIGVLPKGAWPDLFYPCDERWEVEAGAGALSRRKGLMISRADAVIALPGGLGSLDELTEVLTLVHLKEQTKPIGLLNTASFYLPHLALLDHLYEEGFVDVPPRTYLLVERDPALLLQRILAHPHWLFNTSLARHTTGGKP